jgi:hypothetical protein
MTTKAKRSELVLPALVDLGLCLVVLVLSVIAKNHFGPLDGLCNGAAELEPHQSTGAIASCGLNTTIYSVASFTYWAAIVMGVLGAAVLILGLVVAPEKLAASTRQNVTTKVPPSVPAAVRTRAPSRDSGRQHVRCMACNALNYATSASDPCYACGTALQRS